MFRSRKCRAMQKDSMDLGFRAHVALLVCPFDVLLQLYANESLTIILDVFTTKLTDQGRLAPATSTKALTASPTPISPSRLDQALKTAPRLVSDQLINIFFQEWAPLYPVVHRPTILKAYEQYLSDSESFQGNRHDVAQLNLIFAVAALSATVSFQHELFSLDIPC
jgi:hypothetical protein